MTTPEKLGRYEIISELGKGAMGIVYLGRDPLIGRQLALKTFRLGYSAGDQELEQFRVRFLREAQSAGILSHPNIVAIHDVAVDPGGDFFIAMEYVEGTDLKLVMQRQGRFEPSFAVEVVAQIADGLGYAHSKGVVHRDIKPANIIITADKQAKITDFGIARVEASNLTVEGQLLGTPNYMAPEQIQGKEVDHRADIFSLGVMLYEFLTGKKPFAAPNLTAVTHKIVFEPHPPLEQTVPGLPDGITRVLDRALAKDPAQRYDRGADMAADLRAIYADPGASQAIRRSGSFLDDGAGSAAAPPAADVPVPADGGTVVTGDGGTVVTGAGGTVVTGAGGTVVTPPPAAGGTAAAALAAGALPAVDLPAVPAAAPPSSPAAGAPAAGAPATGAPATGTIPIAAGAPPQAAEPGGMPIAGRIAAAVGLIVALAVVGLGVYKLMQGEVEAPRAEDPALAQQQQVQPLVEQGRALLDAGQAEAALEVLERALVLAPADREVRSLRDQAERQTLPDDPEAYAAQRLEAAREAMRDRDYTAAIRIAEGILETDPEHQAGKDLLAEAREGQRRRQEIRARLRNPPQETPPARSRPAPPTSPPPATAAATPSAAPSGEATLVVEFRSLASEGRLTIFSGQKKLYQQPFQFLTAKSGVFGRQRGTSGSLRGTLTLASGDHDLRIYVRLKDAQTRSATVAASLAAGSSRTLTIEVSEEGRVKAALD